MLFIFMGPSCTGKSTAADKVKALTGAEIFTGKDYLKMAKNENEAWKIFREKLKSVASNKDSSKEVVIYLVTEKAQLDKISDIEGSCKVKFTATLDTIKSRFAQRMNGRLPQPVENMLNNQYQQWISVIGDYNVDTTPDSALDSAQDTTQDSAKDTAPDNNVEQIVNWLARQLEQGQ